MIARLYIPRLLYSTQLCSPSLFPSLLHELIALWIFYPRAIAVAIAQLRNRRRRLAAVEAWNGLKSRHHFRSRFRFRVADDPLQGHDDGARTGFSRVRVSRRSRTRALADVRAKVQRSAAGEIASFKSVKFNWEQSRWNGSERRDGHWTRQRSVDKLYITDCSAFISLRRANYFFSPILLE